MRSWLVWRGWKGLLLSHNWSKHVEHWYVDWSSREHWLPLSFWGVWIFMCMSNHFCMSTIYSQRPRSYWIYDNLCPFWLPLSLTKTTVKFDLDPNPCLSPGLFNHRGRWWRLCWHLFLSQDWGFNLISLAHAAIANIFSGSCDRVIPIIRFPWALDTLGWDFWSESGIWTCPISMWEGFSWSSWALHVATTHHTLPAPWLPKRLYTHHMMRPRKCAVNVTGWMIIWDHMSPNSRRLT